MRGGHVVGAVLMVMAVQVLVWHSISKASANRATTGHSSQTVGALFRDKLRGNWVRGNWEAADDDDQDDVAALVALPDVIPPHHVPHASQHPELPPLPPAPPEHVDSAEAAGPAHAEIKGGGKGLGGEAERNLGSAPHGPTGQISVGSAPHGPNGQISADQVREVGAHLHEGPFVEVGMQQISGVVPGHNSSRQREDVAALHEVLPAQSGLSGNLAGVGGAQLKESVAAGESVSLGVRDAPVSVGVLGAPTPAPTPPHAGAALEAMERGGGVKRRWVEMT
ncbi:hypothetical protein T484DRAFT_1659446, partial [Baffinella frigidus]